MDSDKLCGDIMRMVLRNFNDSDSTWDVALMDDVGIIGEFENVIVIKAEEEEGGGPCIHRVPHMISGKRSMYGHTGDIDDIIMDDYEYVVISNLLHIGG
jgi:hypothetical protein